ncbi:MAG: prenyltransferase/squalene oxidase repeat-containing protein [Gemmataceae bacterium]
MRFAIALLILTPAFASAQTEEIDRQIKQKLGAIRFVHLLENPNGGFASGPKDMQVSLKATSAAVRSLKYLTGKKAIEAIPHPKLTTSYVLSCYDAKSGGFADAPGGKPDLYTAAVGIMAAVELEIPKDKYAKCMEYLKENAKSFEDVRIAGAAVEAWGVKDCGFDLKPWLDIAANQLADDGTAGKDEAIPRETASVIALQLRLGVPEKQLKNSNKLDDVLQAGQWKDGGYGRAGAKGSDLESTYRVMRAFMLLKERPKNREAMRAFIEKCRNPDGGFGVKPGDASTVAGTYFATIITKWMNDAE